MTTDTNSVCALCSKSVRGSVPEHQYWSEDCNAHRLFGLGFIGWPQAQAMAARICAERRLAAEIVYVAATRSHLTATPQLALRDTSADNLALVPVTSDKSERVGDSDGVKKKKKRTRRNHTVCNDRAIGETKKKKSTNRARASASVPDSQN